MPILTLTMTDSYADGWNGGYINIEVGGITYGPYGHSGASADGQWDGQGDTSSYGGPPWATNPLVFDIEVIPGDGTCTVNLGPYPGESSFTLVDADGVVLFANKPNGAYAFTVEGDLNKPIIFTGPDETIPINSQLSYDALLGVTAAALGGTGDDLTGDIVATGVVDTQTAGSYTITYNVSDSEDVAANATTKTITVFAGLEISLKKIADGWYGWAYGSNFDVFKVFDSGSNEVFASIPSPGFATEVEKMSLPYGNYTWTFELSNQTDSWRQHYEDKNSTYSGYGPRAFELSDSLGRVLVASPWPWPDSQVTSGSFTVSAIPEHPIFVLEEDRSGAFGDDAYLKVLQGASALPDPGAAAFDYRNNNAQLAVSVSDDVNLSVAGNYTITYSAGPDSHNISASVTRAVKVVEAQTSVAATTQEPSVQDISTYIPLNGDAVASGLYPFTFEQGNGSHSETYSSGQIDQALELDGGDSNSDRGSFLQHMQDFTSNKAVIGAGNFTYSAWVYLDGDNHNAGSQAILADWSVSGRNCAIFFTGPNDATDPNRLFIMVGDGAVHLPWEAQQQNFVTHITMPQNTWFHVVAMRKDGHVYAFIDGQPVALGYRNGLEHPSRLNRVNDPTAERSQIWYEDMFYIWDNNGGTYNNDSRDWSAGGDTSNLWSVVGEYQSEFHPNGMPFVMALGRRETLNEGHLGWAQNGSHLVNGRWTNALAIGGHSVWDWSFKGKLDDVAIWKRALSAEEVSAVYALGQNGHGIDHSYVLSDLEVADVEALGAPFGGVLSLEINKNFVNDSFASLDSSLVDALYWQTSKLAFDRTTAEAAQQSGGSWVAYSKIIHVDALAGNDNGTGEANSPLRTIQGANLKAEEFLAGPWPAEYDLNLPGSAGNQKNCAILLFGEFSVPSDVVLFGPHKMRANVGANNSDLPGSTFLTADFAPHPQGDVGVNQYAYVDYYGYNERTIIRPDSGYLTAAAGARLHSMVIDFGGIDSGSHAAFEVSCLYSDTDWRHDYPALNLYSCVVTNQYSSNSFSYLSRSVGPEYAAAQRGTAYWWSANKPCIISLHETLLYNNNFNVISDAQGDSLRIDMARFSKCQIHSCPRYKEDNGENFFAPLSGYIDETGGGGVNGVMYPGYYRARNGSSNGFVTGIKEVKFENPGTGQEPALAGDILFALNGFFAPASGNVRFNDFHIDQLSNIAEQNNYTVEPNTYRLLLNGEFQEDGHSANPSVAWVADDVNGGHGYGVGEVATMPDWVDANLATQFTLPSGGLYSPAGDSTSYFIAPAPHPDSQARYGSSKRQYTMGPYKYFLNDVSNDKQHAPWTVPSLFEDPSLQVPGKIRVSVDDVVIDEDAQYTGHARIPTDLFSLPGNTIKVEVVDHAGQPVGSSILLIVGSVVVASEQSTYAVPDMLAADNHMVFIAGLLAPPSAYLITDGSIEIIDMNVPGFAVNSVISILKVV